MGLQSADDAEAENAASEWAAASSSSSPAASRTPALDVTSVTHLTATTMMLGGHPAGDCRAVDSIDVQVWDNDPVGHETIWSGLTDENGYFSTPVIDCGRRWRRSRSDSVLRNRKWVVVVDVTDNSIAEWTYTFETSEIEDFTGSFHDFGTPVAGRLGCAPRPCTSSTASCVRDATSRRRRRTSRRKCRSNGPTTARMGERVYEPGPVEIHISTEREWNNETVSHEYGHHFVHMTYDPDPPEPDYCNEICDEDYPDDCGHCMWCEENDHDAWHEGFCNWLADVVTRDYPSRYTHQPSGEPFIPLYTRSQERSGSLRRRLCTIGGKPKATLAHYCATSTTKRRTTTTTIRIRRRSHTTSIFDMLCAGSVPIFRVVYLDQPNTVA